MVKRRPRTFDRGGFEGKRISQINMRDRSVGRIGQLGFTGSMLVTARISYFSDRVITIGLHSIVKLIDRQFSYYLAPPSLILY